MITPEMPKSLNAVIDAIWTTQSSSAYAQALGDDYERAWLLTLAVCDALHCAGIERVPSAAAAQDMLNKLGRNQQILRDFNGRNYRELAATHRITIRTVRRIVERGRGES